jgi:DNA-binding transcriptional regulator YiaG
MLRLDSDMAELDPIRLARVRALAVSGQARQIRERALLSCADVAGSCGVDQATVWRWEEGTRRPHGEAAIRYGELLESLDRAASRREAAAS